MVTYYKLTIFYLTNNNFELIGWLDLLLSVKWVERYWREHDEIELLFKNPAIPWSPASLFGFRYVNREETEVLASLLIYTGSVTLRAARGSGLVKSHQREGICVEEQTCSHMVSSWHGVRRGPRWSYWLVSSRWRSLMYRVRYQVKLPCRPEN